MNGSKIAVAQDLGEQRFLTADQCAARYAISRRTWLRIVKSGDAPPGTLFKRLRRWSLKSLEKWEQGK